MRQTAVHHDPGPETPVLPKP